LDTNEEIVQHTFWKDRDRFFGNIASEEEKNEAPWNLTDKESNTENTYSTNAKNLSVVTIPFMAFHPHHDFLYCVPLVLEQKAAFHATVSIPSTLVTPLSVNNDSSYASSAPPS